MNLESFIKAAKPAKGKAATSKPLPTTSKPQPNAIPAAATAPAKKGGLTVVSNISKPKDEVKAIAPLPSSKKIDVNEFLMLDDIKRLIETESYLAQDDTASSQAKIVASCGLISPEGLLVIKTMSDNVKGMGLQSKDTGFAVLNALLNDVGRPIEPFAVELLPELLVAHGDRSSAVREFAANICKKLSEIMCPSVLRAICPVLMAHLESEDWRVRVGVLNMIKVMSPRMSRQISSLLPTLIPKATDCILDAKKQVQYAAVEALNEACMAITNDDIRPLVPQLVSVIAHPEESIKTLDMLLETTFVINVDSPVLALIAPLLAKSLRSSQTSMMKRKAARVIDSMCRLVQDPRDVAPFMPLLLPALDKVIDEIADMEVCEVTKAAREILVNANDGKVVHDAGNAAPVAANVDVEDVRGHLQEILEEHLPQVQEALIVYRYILQLLSNLTAFGTFANPALQVDNPPVEEHWRYAVAMTARSEWRDAIVPYLSAVLKKRKSIAPASESSDADATSTTPGDSAESKGNQEEAAVSTRNRSESHVSTRSRSESHVSTRSRSGSQGDVSKTPEAISWAIRLAALGSVADNELEANEDDANLCDIEFSLAFGGKILLHNTRLRLGKGRRYGVMGKNGAGKTTLLTNLGSGNIEGLPSHLKTVYVQHDDASDDMGKSVIEEVLSDPKIVRENVTREEAETALRAISFTDTMLQGPRSALSGGWKMKLLIIKAILSKADILLLDEPTNHLDAASVAWLADYVNAQKLLTFLIVSHDTHFMDKVLTDVIHYENRKLVYYHGNLTHFVEIHPEAKYYYELESDMIFHFPKPERLDGINSNTRAIIKLDHCTYTYPGASKPTIIDASVKVCLGSRIAVLGANGAGKSTLIKMLVQESEPDADCGGEVWKHMNLRVAYVAQHSFHHIEQHLDMSPVDYIKWRFHGGVDKEELTKPTKKLTEEEVEERKGERKYGDVKEIVGRRKNGRTMEYECTWVGQTSREPNKYIAVEELVAMGHAKLVQQCDTRVAAMAAGLDVRPLLNTEIQGHLMDFNLEPEYSQFSVIRRLSGGQKVKLVLAAAMWNKPHVIILDEPTNYLDRQALGALTQAIKNFQGGVVIISHHKDFTDALCTESWVVENGRVHTEGDVDESAITKSSVKRSPSNQELLDKPADEGAGNINTAISSEVILNPRTLEGLSKKETRKLERLAQVAGVSLKEYVSKITCKSPEWKWL